MRLLYLYFKTTEETTASPSPLYVSPLTSPTVWHLARLVVIYTWRHSRSKQVPPRSCARGAKAFTLALRVPVKQKRIGWSAKRTKKKRRRKEIRKTMHSYYVYNRQQTFLSFFLWVTITTNRAPLRRKNAQQSDPRLRHVNLQSW